MATAFFCGGYFYPDKLRNDMPAVAHRFRPDSLRSLRRPYFPLVRKVGKGTLLTESLSDLSGR